MTADVATPGFTADGAPSRVRPREAMNGVSMTNLVESLGGEPTRQKVVEECVALIDNQVKSKGGVGGMAVRASYATIKAVKKRFVPEVVDGLLDDWLGKLQPHYDTWSSGSAGSFSEFLIARSDDVAEDLLAVTDARAEKTSHTTAKKMYGRMRGSAKRNVVEAIPELSRLIERHLAEKTAA
jgi:hypothetical protein